VRAAPIDLDQGFTVRRARSRRQRETGNPLMPADSAVIVSGIVAMFAAFMVVLGYVWIWSNQKSR
jgi:hypothetical protein